jgi:tetratricopeptide (TPR) repeat protein
MTASTPPAVARAREPRAPLLLCAAAITGAVLAAYAGGLQGAFVFDDLDSISANPTIRELSTSLAPPEGATVSGRPFLNLTLAANYAASGLNPAGYHALNLAIHAASALLLFGIVRRALGTGAVVAGLSRDRTPVALAAALLWALHPLQVESVEYVIQRAESLMGLLYLLTLYAFIRYAAGGKVAPAWGGVSFGACLLGMGTKEAMATAPLMVFLYDRTFISGSFSAAWRRRKGLLSMLAACWVPLAVQVATAGGRPGSAGFGSGVPWWAYLLAQFRAVAVYIRLAAWPRPLVGDYGRVLAGSPAVVAACAALLAMVALVTVVLILTKPPMGYLGAWFLVILAPSSSIIPVSTEIMALHRMYLPLAALVVIGVLALHAATGGGRAFLALVVLLAAGLALASSRRVRVYATPSAFWSDVALKAPWNAGAWNNLGLIEEEKGDHAAAMVDYGRALEIAPTFATARFNLGRSLLAAGRPADALGQFTDALRFLPNDAAIHHQMGKALAGEGRTGDAVRELHESVALDPGRADTWFDLGAVMEQAGYLPGATEAYSRAVRLNPGYPEARLNYGNLLAQAGRVPEAITQYEDDLRLEPGAADVHNNLGGLLAESGRLPEAKAQFAEALRLKPDYAEARDNLEHVRRMMGEAPRQ